jgi:hypothetical protein
MKKPRRVNKGRGSGSSSTRKSKIVTFEFPDWVPFPVCKLAANIKCWNGADAKLLLIVTRLTSDPRMKNVWTELQKRRRQKYVKTSDFVHPAIAPGLQTSWTPHGRSLRQRAKEMRQSGRHGEATRLDLQAALSENPRTLNILPDSLQDSALSSFFDQVVGLARHPPKLITLREVLRLRKPYAAKASRLRADAAKHEVSSLRKPYAAMASRLHAVSAKHKDDSINERLTAAADAYEELADEVAPRPTSSLVVRRKSRSDEESKGFSIAVIEVTKAIFGQRLFRTVATLANVVFDRTDMTDSRLKKMLALPPLSRAAKGY